MLPKEKFLQIGALSMSIQMQICTFSKMWEMGFCTKRNGHKSTNQTNQPKKSTKDNQPKCQGPVAIVSLL